MGVPVKSCVACGRTITWRKKWERDWDQVKYCSDGCRRLGVSAVDERLTEALRALLDRAPIGRTVDPAVAAAQVGGDDASALQEPARRAARRLVAAGGFEIVQSGRVVDPSTARGAFQIRRTASGR